jgi:hypothetical protein
MPNRLAVRPEAAHWRCFMRASTLLLQANTRKRVPTFGKPIMLGGLRVIRKTKPARQVTGIHARAAVFYF